jgi:hypothetical protein
MAATGRRQAGTIIVLLRHGVYKCQATQTWRAVAGNLIGNQVYVHAGGISSPADSGRGEERRGEDGREEEKREDSSGSGYEKLYHRF